MKPLFLLPTFALAVTGCGSTDCLSADCGVDSPDNSGSVLDTAFSEAKKALESEGGSLPADTRATLTTAISRADVQDCDLVGIMAVRWFGDGNEFDGLLLNLDGFPVADVDGRFAPARNNLGVFAGGYTPFEDGTEPPIICTGEPEPAAGDDVTSGSGCGVKADPESIEPYTTQPIGGTYRGDRTFRGALTRGLTAMPVHGAWMATHENGGIAIGAILECDDSTDDGPILVEPVSD